MSKLFFIFSFLFIWSNLFFGICFADGGRPNIILVLIDDMGWSDLSCFGGEAVRTPNIDRLAKEGISFSQFYVAAPLCSPSRCAVTTGQYPNRWRITSYLDNRQRNIERGVAQWLDVSAPTLPRFLREAGYATGHFGKWHLGGQRDVGDAPLIKEYGFDESLTNFEGLGSRVLPLLNAFDGTTPKKHALGSDNLGRGEIRWENRNRVTTRYVDELIKFIKNADKNNKPFYANLWTDDVHSPFFPAANLRGNSSKKDRYRGVLVELDQQLAPLFELVQNNEKLRDNTLIFLFSDNGPEQGAGSSAPLRGSKGTLYEGGIRSPLIVWGKGLLNKQKQGSKNNQSIIQSTDLVPSVLKIAGVKTPDKVIFDGEDFSEILLGNATEQKRKNPIFWQRPPDRSGTKKEPLPDLALREEQWKFLMQFDNSLPQLYNIENDPSESKNLAEEHKNITTNLQKKLEKWYKSIAEQQQ
ncbi:MAG: sulfatase-like hydrolase/transferase [Planctomycetaceae bacterium]|jgi:uncharacterized sulfatase|nr:sulfatase-like hydrolase/transferase [Planctomycetaceae bacterium]